MKVLYQDARRNPTGWQQIDASEWAALPKRPVPGRGVLGGQDNTPGHLCCANVQGITTEGADHVAIEPLVIGLDEGVRLTTWNDDPDDWPVGERRAIVWTILPLAPDPKLGMAINTRQSCIWFAEGERYDRLVASPPQNTTVRPWSEFVPPPESTTRHGIWLEDAKWDEHRTAAPQHEWGWQHWCDHLPDSETEVETERTHDRQRIPLAAPRRVLKEQRAQGRYHQAEHTITYYQRDTDRAVGHNAYTHEDALEATTATSGTEAVTLNSDTNVLCFSFASPVNTPNSADWPDGIYHAQLNCAAASAGVTYGMIGASSTGFLRVTGDLTTVSEYQPADETNASGTGLKLFSNTVDFAAGLATDRYNPSVRGHGDSHADAFTLTLNTTDSYADGPWVTTSAALTGTITPSATEADIVTGGKTLIITLTGDTWIAAGAASFDLQRDEIIAGIDSAQSEAFGWDLVPKATQSLGGVVRTSDTVVTITWDAFATYNITATETITCTVPATAVVLGVAIVATPTFTVTPVVATTGQGWTGRGGWW